MHFRRKQRQNPARSGMIRFKTGFEPTQHEGARGMHRWIE
jgi:hypothetical protein